MTHNIADHNMELEGGEGSLFDRVGRSVYIRVDLDSIMHNINLMKGGCKNPNIKLMCVVKADAYGHGAIPVSKYLKARGVERLAVATLAEGIQLRLGGIHGPIHVLGNVQAGEMVHCLNHELIPTVSGPSAIQAMADCLHSDQAEKADKERKISSNGIDGHLGSHRNRQSQFNGLGNGVIVGNGHLNGLNQEDLPARGTIHIKVDTGMSRNGCSPSQLPHLVQLCKKLDVPLEGMLTHIADHDDPAFTKHQQDTFNACINPYRDEGYLFHMSGSGAIILGYGTEYDYIRPGISLYGVSGTIDNVEVFASRGFRPALSIIGRPTLVKQCPAGSKIGYGCTYTTQSPEWIGTFPIGYADGIWRCLAGKGFVVRNKTGERCPYVGRVSMDAITVRLPCQPSPGETFTIVTADYDPVSSVTGIASILETIPNEILVKFPTRLPRVYYSAGRSEPLEISDALSLPTFIMDLGKRSLQTHALSVSH